MARGTTALKARSALRIIPPNISSVGRCRTAHVRLANGRPVPLAYGTMSRNGLLRFAPFAWIIRTIQGFYDAPSDESGSQTTAGSVSVELDPPHALTPEPSI